MADAHVGTSQTPAESAWTSTGEEASANTMPITLITGDRLLVTIPETGPVSAAADMSAPDSSPVFHQFVDNDDLYMMPPSAAQLVASGMLDRELFNINTLVEAGYTDATRVIIDYEELTTARAAVTAGLGSTVRSADERGTKDPRLLESISAVATTVTPDGTWWREVLATRDQGAAKRSQVDPLSGVKKVWLDAPLEVSLDESVAQIGAPQAWASGYDGSGVKAAVLDSGIDNEHPDVAGQVIASADFTDTMPSVDDDHGHGTHVASTLAGTGSAADGRYTGVAPGASLLDGKVCDAAGQCFNSSVIAGMEWAADTHDADVINLSLGGCCTDGTDPLAQAVNRLSAQTGALFVISAGNSGGESTIGTPGVAEAALTVGAVDTADQLAGFSSRGPRLGDDAIKPDVTAPGVDIVAARADGTQLGPIVDDAYTQISGTSMAAPHVAGAAAILRQQHPDWTRQDLKGALMSTGVLADYTVWEQGGGRIDVARAGSQGVFSPSGSLSFGIFSPPYDTATKPVTYRNDTDADVTLDLTLAVTDKDGQPAPQEIASPSADQVTVPARSTASVDLTVSPASGEVGRYSGYLTASFGDVQVQTALGFTTEPLKHTVTVNVLDRHGSPAENATFSAKGMGGDERGPVTGFQVEPGVWEFDLPADTYTLVGFVDGLVDGVIEEFTVVGDLEVEVGDEDMALSFDARDAAPVTARVEGHDVTHQFSGLTLWQTGPTGLLRYFAISMRPDDVDYFVQAMEPVTEGSFVLCERHLLTHPELGSGGPELFDLASCDETYGGVPADLSIALGRQDIRQLAKVETTFVANTGQAWFQEQRLHTHVTDSGLRAPVAFSPFEKFAGPVQRTDYVSAGEGLWASRVNQYTVDEDGNPDLLAAHNYNRQAGVQYQPGQKYDETWFQGPLHPTFAVDGTGTAPSLRQESSLDLRIHAAGDSAAGHYGIFHVDNQLEVYEDGALIASDAGRTSASTAPTSWADIPVSPGDHEFRIELDTDVSWMADQYEVDFPHRSPQTHTAWTLQSPAPEGDPTVLPLMFVDYDVPLNQHNELDRPGRANLEFRVMHQDGADGGEISGLNVWLSTDDGETWTPARVRRGSDGVFSSPLLVARRNTGQEVSLKVEAWDEEGNRIEQEIIRAFGIDITR